jgi:hypothetical protein
MTEVVGAGGTPDADQTNLETAAGGGGVTEGGPKRGSGTEGAERTDLTAAAGGGTEGGPKRGSGTGGAGPGIQLPAWAAQVSKELRERPEVAKELAAYGKLDDFAKAYFTRVKEAAHPGKDAGPEELEAFWRKLGKPEKKEGYSFAKEEDAGAFLEAAFGAHLTDGQASAVWKTAVETADRRTAETLARQTKELEETDAALRKEYGDGYAKAVQMFMRGIGNAEGKSSPVSLALQKAGLAGRPEIVRAFIALGEAVSESGSPRGGGARGGWKSVRDGGGFSYKKT